MVQDVIEARNNGWRVRNEAAGPKLTAEIREEVRRPLPELPFDGADLYSLVP